MNITGDFERDGARDVTVTGGPFGGGAGDDIVNASGLTSTQSLDLTTAAGTTRSPAAPATTRSTAARGNDSITYGFGGGSDDIDGSEGGLRQRHADGQSRRRRGDDLGSHRIRPGCDLSLVFDDPATTTVTTSRSS